MFTGIVEAVGEVRSIRMAEGGGRELSVTLPEDWLAGVRHGDSISVHGICLTVVGTSGNQARFQVVRETVARTTLAAWAPGTRVNLERSLAADGRFGGHIVMGHVDTTTLLRAERDAGTGKELVFALPAELGPLIVEKGSVALDGISLTVAAAADDIFEVAVIPETLTRTTIGTLHPGDRVNVEADIFARYVRKALETLGRPAGRIDMDFLKEHGFA